MTTAEVLALHRFGRPHPRAPDGDARLCAGEVPGSDLAYRDRRGGRGVARLQRQTDACQRDVGRRCGRRQRRRPGPGLPGRDALHRDPAGGLECQGPPAGHGPGPHRSGRAVPDDAARPAERSGRRLRRGPGPGLQRLVLGSRAGGRGSALRRRGGAADARAGRRGPGGGGDPPGGRSSGHGVGLHAAESGRGLAAVQRSGLRPDLAGGVGHGTADRPAPVPGPGSARGVPGPAAGPAAPARWELRRRLRPGTHPQHRATSSNTPSSVRARSLPRRSPTRST